MMPLHPLFTTVLLALTMAQTGAAVPAPQSQVAPHAGMLRYPDVSSTHIVFGYANDLWLVPRAGGTALPLSSPPGQETFPRFSPDGQTIAFVGNYEGNRDLYTLSRGGGLATRVTHHPGSETLCDWTPDGQLLFFTAALATHARKNQLFTVPATGGLPAQLPVPYGANGAVSADGRWLAYTPHTRDIRTWKRYLGGMATDIWLFDLESSEARRITEWPGTDSLPMWHAKKVYYLSDAGPAARLNIWVHDPRTGQNRQVTTSRDFDVKWPSLGPGPGGGGEIVFQRGAGLYLLDLPTGKTRRIEITIPGDRPTLRRRTVDAREAIAAWDISATGKRAVIEARGDIWTAPAGKGAPRNLTRTDGIAERSPAWSPDGRWIAYFCDAEGEYDLVITQSDGKGETRRLTKLGPGFRRTDTWSPDSKWIAFTDEARRIFVHHVEKETTQEVDANPRFSTPTMSWSHDSRWLTYSRGNSKNNHSSIWIYELETGEKRQVTSDMFSDGWPAFDRKGDYLFFTSSRRFQPTYSDLDSTFIYGGTQVLMAAPLRADVKPPWPPESDEEPWGEKKTDEADDDDAEADEGGTDAKPAADAPQDDVSGLWEGTAEAGPPADQSLSIAFQLTLHEDDHVSGSVSLPEGTYDITRGSYDRTTGKLTLTIVDEDGVLWTVELKIEDNRMSGRASSPEMPFTVAITATRSIAEGEEAREAQSTEEKDGKKDSKKREKVTIDFPGFEQRAFMLPVKSGAFRHLHVNHKNELIYARVSEGLDRGKAGIKLFSLEDEKKEEKSVASGSTSFTISADGKKLLVLKGRDAAIQDAAAGGKSKPVTTAGMRARVDPRAEWRQMFMDAWRIFRDHFYDPGMHGVDWTAIRENYHAMLQDCASREDLDFVIGEMIAELNVGHAYVRGGGDREATPRVTVGLLGVDFELHENTYRIARIHEGAAWDADARGPLSEPGMDVSEGDYLLAVDGQPIATDQDPWAAFQGKAGQVVTLTVSKKPVSDEEAREVLVKPIASEGNLRYRAGIEEKRAHVDQRSGGRVGYIYVPNTGRNGQNDLFRQFYGQSGKQALIIDERWNGGGQIPTRFIELLNRPVTNYWAVRHGTDWTWPPDGHHGPKCMLINGLAGSGGDAFPFYFRQAGMGKLIGTRTWGGLVGLSGNPTLIDGGRISVPTFGFYERDGTWGIEGHGVAPDIEVIDDPALMLHGEDPQLDRAIDLMLAEIRENPYRPPQRPPYPDRSGIGVNEADR